MKASKILTITGAYWHYNPLGTGVIYTYHTKAKQVISTCAHTGQLIEVKDLYEEGGFDSVSEFQEAVEAIYLCMAEEGVTIDYDYLDDPDIIESGEVALGLDLKLLLN